MMSPAAFGHWWVGQMSALLAPLSGRLLPSRLRGAVRDLMARRRPPVLVVDMQAARLTLLPRVAGEAPRVAAFSAEGMADLAGRLGGRRRPVAAQVVMPGLALLRRRVRLPAGARGEAGALVGYDLDRLTPFRRDELLWSLDPLPGEGGAGQAEFRLTCTPRAPVMPWLDALRAGGLRPVRLAAGTGPGAPAIALEPAARAVTRARAGAALLAAAILLGAPFLWQEVAARRVQAGIDALAAERTLAERLRARMDALASGSALLDREARRSGAPLTVLAALTDALPDDTFLDSLTLKDGQLAIQGQSGAASRLIARLEGTGTIREPSFAGPVLHLPGVGADSFSIHALAGEAAGRAPAGAPMPGVSTP